MKIEVSDESVIPREVEVTSIRTTRSIATLGALALVAGAFLASPAEAKKKKRKACPAYVSPAWATDAGDTQIVTDAHTADAPLEIEVATEAGLGFTNPSGPDGDSGAPTHRFVNIVVDSAASTATLHVRADYAPVYDYDLFLRAPEMPAVAYEADFNPATAAGPTPVGGYEGGHAEPGVSEILGYATIDCAPYTVDLASAITPGEAVPVTIWLGE